MSPPRRQCCETFRAAPRLVGVPLLAAQIVSLSAGAPAHGAIETEFIEAAWRERPGTELEVGPHPVRWRQHVGEAGELFAGVAFTAPLAREAFWEVAADPDELEAVSPDIVSVTVLESSPSRRVVQIDARILWMTVPLTFEIEEDRPELIRFRLLSGLIGEFRGVCRLTDEADQAPDEPRTSVELSTWLNPSRPVPGRLVLALERMVMLNGVRELFGRYADAPPDSGRPGPRGAAWRSSFRPELVLE
ncbi:MAG TPA: SRPBCC family protein [bacterium]